jgi:hypothetical protein
MPTRMQMIYKDHQLKAFKEPHGGWAVEIVPVGEGGRTWSTQVWKGRSEALASARRIIDNGVTQ